MRIRNEVAMGLQGGAVACHALIGGERSSAQLMCEVPIHLVAEHAGQGSH